MPAIEKSGYRKWWPMREIVKRDKLGRTVYREVFRNMETGESHYPKDKDGKDIGWNGEPPPLSEGEKIMETSDRFKQNFDQIRMSKTSKLKKVGSSGAGRTVYVLGT